MATFSFLGRYQLIVKPFPKVKNPLALFDLRPISILPTFPKLLEKTMEHQIRKYLDPHNILPACQAGFRAGCSTATALTQVTDSIVSNTDNKESTALVALDVS